MTKIEDVSEAAILEAVRRRFPCRGTFDKEALIIGIADEVMKVVSAPRISAPISLGASKVTISRAMFDQLVRNAHPLATDDQINDLKSNMLGGGAPTKSIWPLKDRSKKARVTNPSIKWKRTESGYKSEDGRFVILKDVSRAYTRGPFKNFWSLTDTKTGAHRNAFDGLIDAKDWAEGIVALAATKKSSVDV